MSSSNIITDEKLNKLNEIINRTIMEKQKSSVDFDYEYI